jgi:hypothetical protein
MEVLKFTEDGRVKLPQPHELSAIEKDDAMGAYLMMFAAWGAGLPLPLLNLIAAVIYFFINKKQSRFVACVKARKGQFYYFIFFGRIAFEQYYGEKAQRKKEKEIINIPPKGY